MHTRSFLYGDGCLPHPTQALTFCAGLPHHEWTGISLGPDNSCHVMGIPSSPCSGSHSLCYTLPYLHIDNILTYFGLWHLKRSHLPPSECPHTAWAQTLHKPPLQGHFLHPAGAIKPHARLPLCVDALPTQQQAILCVDAFLSNLGYASSLQTTPSMWIICPCWL